MKRRTFTKTSTAIMTGTLLSSLPGLGKDDPRKNWAGNYQYSANNLHLPKSLEQVQGVVRKTSQLKALGTRHSFNGVADSMENQISLRHLNKILSLDAQGKKVTVEPGVRYGELGQYLYAQGFALHNLASLPHISVAGACATATHGSGVDNGNLATAVAALEIVTADGELVTLSKQKDGERFKGAVVGLGGLGVVTKVTLDLLPSFEVTQDVYLDLPMDQLTDHFSHIFSSGYSVSLFTDWQKSELNQVWIKRKVGEEQGEVLGPEFYEAKPANRDVHPIIAISAENCTQQMSVPGPWHERLPHFRLNFTPSSGEELQSEYFIPYQNAEEAILAIQRLGTEIGPYLFISEIRAIAADNLWMSPCYKQPCITLHFTWKPDGPGVSRLMPRIEKELMPFGVRPHWGKLFTIPPAQLQQRYERLPDFKNLMTEFDPNGKFRNAFLDSNLFG